MVMIFTEFCRSDKNIWWMCILGRKIYISRLYFWGKYILISLSVVPSVRNRKKNPGIWTNTKERIVTKEIPTEFLMWRITHIKINCELHRQSLIRRNNASQNARTNIFKRRQNLLNYILINSLGRLTHLKYTSHLFN